MELLNETPLQVELVTGASEQGPHLERVQVLAKAMGTWDPSGAFHLDLTQPPPIFRERVATPWHADIPADLSRPKQGCDIVVLGRAYSPTSEPVESSEIQLSVGQDTRRMLVFGERVWEQRQDGQLTPSAPLPFSVLDLSWENSFGGMSYDAEGNDAIYPFNPNGMGFQVSEEVAAGRELPHFEDPDDRIVHWQDMPCPCNIAPISEQTPLMLWPDPAPLAQAMKRGETIHIPPSYHNVAHPKFRFSNVAPGQTLRLRGATPGDPLELRLPELELRLRAQIAERTHESSLSFATIVILPEVRSCIFTWTHHFAYRFNPKERRCVRVTTAPSSTPAMAISSERR